MSADAGPPALTTDLVRELAGCAAVFVAADPPRAGTVVFWRPGGGGVPGASGTVTVVRPHGAQVRRREAPAAVLPLGQALDVLLEARRSPGGDPAAVFWGAAVVLALQLLARGRLLPGVSLAGFDAWRIGPYEHEDLVAVRELAAAMPPNARAVPLADRPGVELPRAEPLVRAFADAVADVLARTPGGPVAAGGPLWTAAQPQPVPEEERRWAADVAVGLDAGVRVSLRFELPDTGAADWDGAFPGNDGCAGGCRVVVQLHQLAEGVVADAGDVWSGRSAAAASFGPQARTQALLGLRRAARAWAPVGRLLEGAAPVGLDLSEEEVSDLLGGASAALAAAGVQVHWPRELAKRLLARGVVGSAEKTVSDLPSMLSAQVLLSFRWHITLGDRELDAAELDRLAEATRPLVRLRDQWVLIDPAVLARARDRLPVPLTPVEALGSVLAGSTDIGGEAVEVTAVGWLAELKERLADPEAAARRRPVAPPAALNATLRGYQVAGLTWLDQMTSLGLGGCLADDMGLGKTLQIIALHLHRARSEPTLVVCPTSLLSNWQREIERFAPGTPVLRFHGARGTLAGAGPGFVLTTYATMRLRAAELAECAFGLVVADEAQHVKNASSSTAKALRTLRAPARIALTGTPMENQLADLWALLDFTTPGLLGTLKEFRDRYARGAESGKDPEAARRLGALIAPFLLRRRKSDPGIAPELGAKTVTDHAVALSREQVALYEAVVRETMAAIRASDGIARRGLVLKLLGALKQICNHPAQFLGEAGPGTRPGRSGKLDLLDELLDTILAEERSVLVFTQYVEMGRLIESHLAGRGVPQRFLYGGVPVKRRDRMVEDFQAGRAPVFLLSLKAAGSGLNLARASHVIHFDRWWNPAVEEQASDRAYRIGQTQNVQVHRFVAEGTVEDRIAELLASKQALADAVLGSGGEKAFTELSDTELADFVRLRRIPR
ncbi:DEAD/DEAH box helicase [Streptomyces sp. BE303]|uniref:DEAD/DEAH box helicase n=1 Tax=Streptomyces sp. BE303 TaxID=3002528 RepID=UPI002E77F0CA|nr:DEAD/DEAH box helicase [Streptomyces sp. BE303]MED7947581.1 DEAD/DEAH box helicase [Streptomyces sp. BE303]